MLVPITYRNRRVWVDVSFRYEKHIYAGSTEDVARYTLKYGRANGIYEDEEIAHDLKRTVSAMLRDGIPPRQVVEEASALYGIPEEYVEEAVLAAPPQ
ncbi:MAG TPA: hypothetical protein PKV78_05450 [Methanoculleus thermophilus]|jgi:hypothetical protein|nr:hypothetical protein [Bacillota bacterium]HQD25972.1 hypothetical protein [Methanoculleus thermophilus]